MYRRGGRFSFVSFGKIVECNGNKLQKLHDVHNLLAIDDCDELHNFLNSAHVQRGVNGQTKHL